MNDSDNTTKKKTETEEAQELAARHVRWEALRASIRPRLEGDLLSITKTVREALLQLEGLAQLDEGPLGVTPADLNDYTALQHYRGHVRSVALTLHGIAAELDRTVGRLDAAIWMNGEIA